MKGIFYKNIVVDIQIQTQFDFWVVESHTLSSHNVTHTITQCHTHCMKKICSYILRIRKLLNINILNQQKYLKLIFFHYRYIMILHTFYFNTLNIFHKKLRFIVRKSNFMWLTFKMIIFFSPEISSKLTFFKLWIFITLCNKSHFISEYIKGLNSLSHWKFFFSKTICTFFQFLVQDLLLNFKRVLKLKKKKVYSNMFEI